MDNQLQLLKRNLPEDSPQLLNEQLRAGELTVNQVKLASQLDYKPARQLFPNEELVDWSVWKKRKDFLDQFDKSFLVSLACDFAEHVIHIWEYKPKDTRPRSAIKAARKWIADPSEENRQAANAAAAAAYTAAYTAANAAAAAAYTAAYTAANAAYAAANAAYAAAYAANAVDAADAADTAYAADAADAADAATNKEQEFAWQKEHLARLILQ